MIEVVVDTFLKSAIYIEVVVDTFLKSAIYINR